MRVLLVNHRYFVASGAERYLFNVERALENRGHETAPFSIAYDSNKSSPWSEYFTSPIGTSEQIYFDQYRSDPKLIAKSVGRLLHSREVYQDIYRIAKDFIPDLAYVMLFQRKLSPSIFFALKKLRIPIVVRISDYGFLCAENTFSRRGAVCTECHPSRLWPAIKNACVHDSRLISAASAAAASFHRAFGYFDAIDKFVTTNKFLTDMMVEGGYSRSRLICIPTFVSEKFKSSLAVSGRKYFLYAGRLDPAKGLETLIDAMAIAYAERPEFPDLVIAGGPQYKAYEESLRLRCRLSGLTERIHFRGFVPADEMPELYSQAIASIIPALWFENLPNSYLESIASGVPVIASNLGSLSSTINDGIDGYLFNPGDPVNLASKLFDVFHNNYNRKMIITNALGRATSEFSETSHMISLERLFEEVCFKSSISPAT